MFLFGKLAICLPTRYPYYDHTGLGYGPLYGFGGSELWEYKIWNEVEGIHWRTPPLAFAGSLTRIREAAVCTVMWIYSDHCTHAFETSFSSKNLLACRKNRYHDNILTLQVFTTTKLQIISEWMTACHVIIEQWPWWKVLDPLWVPLLALKW